MSAIDTAEAAAIQTAARPRSSRNLQLLLGAVATGVVILLAVAGPFLAPHAPSDIVDAPFQPPGGGHLLGTDYLGQDVWSRVLAGGWSVVWMSVAVTGLGVMLGTLLGLVAGYARRYVGGFIVWLMDVLLAFPQIVFVLLFVSLFGHSPLLIVLLVALGWSPTVGRLVRGVTLQTVEQEFVEAAEMMGVPRSRILLREILPNIVSPLIVQTGAVLTWSIGMIAGLSFLGYGIQAPQADWGLMVNENRAGLVLQPWATLAPVLLIALFTVATNTLGEGISRRMAGLTDRSGE